MEYILPISIIAMTVLIGFGSMVPTLMDSLKGNMNADSEKSSGKAVVLNPMGQIGGSQSVILSMKDGTILSMKGFAYDTAALVETVGTDGATEEMAAKIMELADKLKAEGKLTDAQYNQLQALSNQAHRIAGLEKLITDTVIASNANMDSFDNSGMNFEGRGYEPWSFAVMLSTGTTDPINGSFYQPASLLDSETKATFGIDPAQSKIGTLMMDLLQQYKAAKDGGALDDPSVNQVITTLTRDVTSLGLETGKMQWNVMNHVWQMEAANQNMAADLTHQDAAHICNTGGGEDTGVHCPS